MTRPLMESSDAAGDPIGKATDMQAIRTTESRTERLGQRR
jgi:hypothetical protein